MRNRAFWQYAILALCTVFLGVAGASAQTLERGAIHGFVYDASGSAVPGVKVTLTSPATGLKRELTTNSEGGYDFEALTPGEYTLVVEGANFASYTVKEIVVTIGSSIALDAHLRLKTAEQSVTVTAEAAGAVDTSTAGVTQLLNEKSVENLPLEGRDYRDLAQLTPSVSVVPGLRGGLRLGGQQSDYSGLVIDGADSTNNFFGENFGSLETKNLTVPLEAVQEFQVVVNGFAPEFGRASGGLLNVVTKSGTNDIHGEAHEYYRGGGLTADDALHTPSNINRQNQFGGSVGFPIRKDRQFLFLSTDIQREHGPLTTQFCPAGNAACAASLLTPGPTIPATAVGTEILPKGCKPLVAGQPNFLLPTCYGVPNLAGFLGANNQYQNFFTLLGHYDYQFSPANHFSIRGIGTRNHTNGFTGGQGQTETFDAIGNTENFVNQGVTGVFSLTTVQGSKVNELRASVNGETRKRKPIQSGVPEIQISGIGNFGQRFYLPGNNDNGKLQVQDNFSYAFAKHDIKFGGDVNSFVDRKDIFAGWSAGQYDFNSITDFNNSNAFGFIEGFGLNGKDVFVGNTLFPAYQTGIGLYFQDKWQITPRITLTYGLRWDGTQNPQPQSPFPGQTVLVGQGTGSKPAPIPQRVPDDFRQWGPRVGVAWNVAGTAHPTVVRGAVGLYYAQNPTIFFPSLGGSKNSTLFCFFNPNCLPQSGFPYLFPSSLPFGVDQLCANAEGCPSPTYVDPKFRNPRVTNLTVGVEHSLTSSLNVSVTYAFAHSDFLRTGGFSTTQWARNFVKIGTDPFGRSILGTSPLDPTLGGSTDELASFSRGNYHQLVVAVNKRYARRYQFFANYTWSQNKSNASAERDTDTFFGPQDPFNLNLDYGIDGLDIAHQFKAGGVVDLPYGFNWSTSIIAHSGLAYPAYITTDVNGDFVSNQGFGTNDRPIIQLGSGKPFLLPLYPGRQPSFFNWDMRLAKDIRLRERYIVRLSADIFNLTNASNLYSNPDHSAFIDYFTLTTTPACTPIPNSISISCPALTSLPKVGQISNQNGGTKYRTLDQLSPGASAFAAQFGVRFQF